MFAAHNDFQFPPGTETSLQVGDPDIRGAFDFDTTSGRLVRVEMRTAASTRLRDPDAPSGDWKTLEFTTVDRMELVTE